MAIERSAVAVSPEGERSIVRFVISDPARNRVGDLYVALCLLGLDQHSHTVYGSDHWQAVDLAMVTARERFEYFTDAGWQFFWERDESDEIEFEVSPEDMRDDWPVA